LESPVDVVTQVSLVRNEQGAGKDEHHLRAARSCAAEWGSKIVRRIFQFEHQRLDFEQLGGPLGRRELVGRKSVEENRQSGPIRQRLRKQLDLFLRQFELQGEQKMN
jgi:hypothetical protein